MQEPIHSLYRGSKKVLNQLLVCGYGISEGSEGFQINLMSLSDPLGTIWYLSEPSDVLYSTNQLNRDSHPLL